MSEAAAKLGISDAAIARSAGIGTSTFARYKGGEGVPNSERLEPLADALKETSAWLLYGRRPSAEVKVETEVLATGHVGFGEMNSLVFGDDPLPALPLFGSAQGADMEDDFETIEVDLGEVLDYLQRPVALADDRDSYALTVVGTSMHPRFKPRERVGVSPRAPIEIGDDVIVQLRGENSNRVRRVLIKELVRRGADHVILGQYNPARELRIEKRDILAMHKVKGHFL